MHELHLIQYPLHSGFRKGVYRLRLFAVDVLSVGHYRDEEPRAGTRLTNESELPFTPS